MKTNILDLMRKGEFSADDLIKEIKDAEATLAKEKEEKAKAEAAKKDLAKKLDLYRGKLIASAISYCEAFTGTHFTREEASQFADTLTEFFKNIEESYNKKSTPAKTKSSTNTDDLLKLFKLFYW